MDSITELPELGTLRTVEVFEYYDGPRLFSCRDSSGRLYLALSVGETSRDQTWLYVGLSEDRYRDLEGCRIDLRDAVTGAEDGTVWKVTTPSVGQSEVERFPAATLPADWLPDSGEFLTACK